MWQDFQNADHILDEHVGQFTELDTSLCQSKLELSMAGFDINTLHACYMNAIANYTRNCRADRAEQKDLSSESASTFDY